jgi:peroxin-3
MISATRRWLRRNRNGLAIAAGVVGATYLAGQYVVSKISEARERSNLDRIAKEKYTAPLSWLICPCCTQYLTYLLPSLRRRFEQNQTDCTFTVLALLPTVTENILEALPVEQLTHELQQKKAERLARVAGEGVASELSSGPPSIRDGDTASLSSLQSSSYIHASQLGDDGSSRPRRSKAQLWNEIKIASITRSFTLVYTLSLLTLLTRIQLNLLGRLNYLSSVVSLTRPPPLGRANSISLEDHDNTTLNPNSSTHTSANFGNDFETNRRYLTFSWFLLHRGYNNLLTQLRDAVTEVFGSISPTEAVTTSRLSELTLAVRRKIEGSTEQERQSTRWLPYLLPPRDDEQSVLVESGVITPPHTSSSDSPEKAANKDISSSGPLDASSDPLRSLLDETADLIDSPTFTSVHTLLLNTLFSYLIDTKVAQQAFPLPTNTQSPPSSAHSAIPPLQIQELHPPDPTVPPEQRTVKLATILAVLTRQAHAIGNGSNPPNEYVSAMEIEVKELEAFAAVIYASNLDAGLENIHPNVAEGNISGIDGVGMSDVGQAPGADEMLESQLEGAWSKIMGSTRLR